MSRSTRSAKARMMPSPNAYATNHWQAKVKGSTMYITAQDELHVEYQGIALTCPHCQTLTHLTAVAVPKFEDLARRKPKHVGIVFGCDACAEPVFLKFFFKAYTPLRVDLAPNYTEIELARGNF